VPDCLFCKIATREIEADVVRDASHLVAFRDIHPVAPTHILIVPKQHLSSARDLDQAHAGLLGELFVMIKEIAIEEGLSDGYRVVTNVGVDAGQSVDHLHWHLLGGRAMGWPPG
jgi:histidine triad (HIT) family protein